jgi:hypothetical protein
MRGEELRPRQYGQRVCPGIGRAGQQIRMVPEELQTYRGQRLRQHRGNKNPYDGHCGFPPLPSSWYSRCAGAVPSARFAKAAWTSVR